MRKCVPNDREDRRVSQKGGANDRDRDLDKVPDASEEFISLPIALVVGSIVVMVGARRSIGIA